MQQAILEEAERFIYLSFKNPKSSRSARQRNIFRFALFWVIRSVIARIIPKANPDFEGQIEDVISWLVECAGEGGMPEREIGLDNTGRPIMKMPYRNNYGYWTDNNMKASDFLSQFNATEVTQELFENNWARYN